MFWQIQNYAASNVILSTLFLFLSHYKGTIWFKVNPKQFRDQVPCLPFSSSIKSQKINLVSYVIYILKTDIL